MASFLSSIIPSSSEIQYSILNKGSRAAVGAGTRFLAGHSWKLVTSKKPPLNPAMPGVQWGEALAWGALVGMISGMLGIVARRMIAGGWRKYVGAKPEEPHA